MKTYVKIYGPPIIEALKALEKVAIEVSKELPEILFYNSLGAAALPRDDAASMLSQVLGVPRDEAIFRYEKMISKSGWTLGDYDFFFEWTVPPTFEQLKLLISKIDEALKPLGCKYTVTTK
ncbi:MAG: hypothetical protein NZ926_01075 [Candidatus Methanomethylicia archaeon]|nr:hypothetical protein [Candidatus Methanomethylicia archaeon]MCX8169022.1 hypothetical protein [Candidatus Methanomethylicia archaeon]MDW7988754.1 hypothetical protein [Nitrososphaerota archaeon]